MDWYTYIAWAAILVQFLFVYNAARNYRFVMAKHDRRDHPHHRPRTTVILPCKGLDARFDANIESFFNQDYDNFSLLFVVQEQSDPAYETLHRIRRQRQNGSNASEVRILVAGLSTGCSQKIHNLLHALDHANEETEILAFADSDICVRPNWLRQLVWPLRRPRCGVATGYRWFIPNRRNLATLGLSAVNSAVAQLLGNNRFSHAWGGSMAMRAADFRRLGLPALWRTALSDDLSLSQTVKKAGLNVMFVPACLVASYEATTWAHLYEFCRRQFLITRIYAPLTWWLGFLSNLGSVVGFWATAALAGYAWTIGAEHRRLFLAVPILFLAGQVIRAVLRQSMIVRLFREHAPSVHPAVIADILGCWFWSIVQLVFMISSAFGRTIHWRGIRYRLISPTQIEIVRD